MEQGVAGHDVGVGLGAALGVDHTGDIIELAENVETVEHQQQAALEEGAHEAGVPHEVVGVHLRVGIASARVERQVGGEVELPREFEDGRQSGAAGEGVDVLEVFARAGQAVPNGLAGEVEVVLPDVGAEGGADAEGEAVDDGAFRLRHCLKGRSRFSFLAVSRAQYMV